MTGFPNRAYFVPKSNGTPVLLNVSGGGRQDRTADLRVMNPSL